MARGEQRAAELRRLDAALAHARDWRAEGLGELAQQRGDGGLRERQLLGGAGNASQAHHGLEGHELRQEAVAEETSQSGAGHAKAFVEVGKGLANGRSWRTAADHTGAGCARIDDVAVKATPLWG
jgi:hypothetical protein